MAISAQEVRNKILSENAEVRREYNALEAEYTALRKIIRCRLAQNMSKEQLARRAGVTRRVVEEFETDTGSVPLCVLCKIANAVGMELNIQVQPKRY